jgi:hypothetical protein
LVKEGACAAPFFCPVREWLHRRLPDDLRVLIRRELLPSKTRRRPDQRAPKPVSIVDSVRMAISTSSHAEKCLM